MRRWTTDNIPDQSGKVIIVTGSNSGIGYEAVKVLAKKRGHLIMACRSKERGEKAMSKLQAEISNSKIELRILDLADLDSVSDFATNFLIDFDRLDILINNAGVMMTPNSKTVQGIELQFGVNFVGHFALTGLLFNLLSTTNGSRVVNLSSLAHRNGKIDFDNLKSEKSYERLKAYNRSKLADLIFSLELQRRIEANNLDIISTAAHPGMTKTELNRHSSLMTFLSNIFTQSAEMGVLPTLRAAFDQNIKGGEYFGPSKLFEAFGHPVKAIISKDARDIAVAKRLWEVGEELSGVKYLSE